ncbi:MAG: permease-like cell division protein FtsX, partial [Pseudomonadales bacterium]|nr:permease-like cell division protein FtsX [Pseudomonadales bacterium]
MTMKPGDSRQGASHKPAGRHAGGRGSTKVTTSQGASVAGVGMADQFSAWFAHHRKVAVETISGLLKVWPASLMTWLMIGIALALPAILYLILNNVSHISGDWDGTARFSVYLQETVSEAEGQQLASRWENEPFAVRARFISSAQALEEFRALSGFGDVLATLDTNPLPAVIELEPASRQGAELRLLIARLETEPGVASVSYDLDWLQRLFLILEVGERLVTALACFLGLGVVLAIGNTIRLAIENRRAEIEIIKLVGGTDSFVRRPFLYLGFWYGVGGALLAWMLVNASLWFLSGPVELLVDTYQKEFSLGGLGFNETLILFLTGAMLGIGGAAVAVGRHLSR